MPFYEKGDVRIHYQEVGSGFPLLVIPGGGLNSTFAGLANHPFNPVEFASSAGCRADLSGGPQRGAPILPRRSAGDFWRSD
jgi:hypothetical protein